MAHFTELDGNLVTNVIVVNNEVLDSTNEEASGLDFLESIYGHRNFKQTSYNGNFRLNYAGIGFTYDEQRDAFIPPKPFASWVLNEDNCLWQAPVAYPTDGNRYAWNEDNQSWDLLEEVD